MDAEELRIRLKVGKSKNVVICFERCMEYVGYVKTVTIMNEKRVRIEYNVYGYEEAGFMYFVEFENTDIMIANMENYLEMPFGDWKNLSPESDYPPEWKEIYDIGLAHAKIREDWEKNKIKLPENGFVQRKEG